MPGQRAKNKKVVSVTMDDELRDQIDQYAKDNNLLRPNGLPDRTAVVKDIAGKMLVKKPKKIK